MNSVNVVASEILVAGDEFITKVKKGIEMDERLTELEFATKIANLEATCSGYMFSGERASLIDYSIIWDSPTLLRVKHEPNKSSNLHFKHHHSQSYDDTPTDFYINKNLSIFKHVPIGTQVRVSYDDLNVSKTEYYEKVEEDVWSLVFVSDAEEVRMYQETKSQYGFLLYKGIREDVAKKLNTELNDEFHKLFDAAVQYMDVMSDDLPPCSVNV